MEISCSLAFSSYTSYSVLRILDMYTCIIYDTKVIYPLMCGKITHVRGIYLNKRCCKPSAYPNREIFREISGVWLWPHTYQVPLNILPGRQVYVVSKYGVRSAGHPCWVSCSFATSNLNGKHTQIVSVLLEYHFVFQFFQWCQTCRNLATYCIHSLGSRKLDR